MSKYYDWKEAISNDAETTIIVGKYGLGRAHSLMKKEGRILKDLRRGINWPNITTGTKRYLMTQTLQW